MIYTVIVVDGGVDVIIIINIIGTRIIVVEYGNSKVIRVIRVIRASTEGY